jgi:hypothetical protein
MSYSLIDLSENAQDNRYLITKRTIKIGILTQLRFDYSLFRQFNS